MRLCDVKLNAGGDTTWPWMAYSVSDDSPAHEQFAFQLKTVASAQAFQCKFTEAKQLNRGKCHCVTMVLMPRRRQTSKARRSMDQLLARLLRRNAPLLARHLALIALRSVKRCFGQHRSGGCLSPDARTGWVPREVLARPNGRWT